jgi:hypothetical protein
MADGKLMEGKLGGMVHRKLNATGGGAQERTLTLKGAQPTESVRK